MQNARGVGFRRHRSELISMARNGQAGENLENGSRIRRKEKNSSIVLTYDVI